MQGKIRMGSEADDTDAHEADEPDAKEDCEQCLFGIALSAENDDGMKFKCVAGADLGSAMSAKPMVMMASLTVFI